MVRRWLLSLWRRAFVRFLVVGVLNTAFGYTVFAALILLGVHRTVALTVATVLGVLFNFQTVGRVVFRSRDLRLLLRFAAVYAVVYLVNVALLELWCRAVGLGPLAGQALSLPAAVLLAFSLMRGLVFGRSRASEGEGVGAKAD